MNQEQAKKIEKLYILDNLWNDVSCRIIQASYDNGKAPAVRENGTGNDIAVLLEYKKNDHEFFPSAFLRNKIDFEVKIFRYTDLCTNDGFMEIVLIV